MGCIVSPRRGRVGTTYIFFQYTLPVLLRIAVACQLARASASLARSAMISIKGTRAPTLLAMPRRRTSVRLKNTSSEGHASMGDLSRFGPPALTRSSLSFFRRSFHLLRIPRDSVMASVDGRVSRKKCRNISISRSGFRSCESGRRWGRRGSGTEQRFSVIVHHIPKLNY